MWPDWRGQTVAVIAAGASARDLVARIPGRPPAIVINRSHELAPWATILYGADRAFWVNTPAARAFAGLKACSADETCKRYGLARVVVAVPRFDGPLRSPIGTVGHGGNSGFQAVNLAAQFGARRIVLVGLDYRGDHWHGQHAKPLRNACPRRLGEWAAHLDAAAPAYRAWGVDIVNASPASALRAYPKIAIETAFHEALAA